MQSMSSENQKKCYLLALTHVGGSQRIVRVIDTFPGYLSVRWGGSNFDVFEVCIVTGQLVGIKGGRVAKRFKWKGNMDECNRIYSIMRSKNEYR